MLWVDDQAAIVDLAKAQREDTHMATSSMIKPCNICGDIGVSEAIVVCCECKVARVHLYCMKEVKMQIPEWWCCDECKQNKLSSPSPKPVENELKPKKVSFTLKKTTSTSQKRTHSPSLLGFKEKWVSKGKTQYLSCDEAVKLSASHRMSNSLTPHVFQRSTGLKETCCSTPQKERNVVQQSFSPKGRNVESNLQKPVVQQSFSPGGKAVKSSMPSRSVEGTKPEREMKTSKGELLHPKKAAGISGLIEEAHKLLKERGKTENNSGKADKSFMPSRRVEGPNPERQMKTSKNELLHHKKAADIGGLIEEVPELLKEHEKTKNISDCKTNADVEAAGKPNLTMLARAEQDIIHDLPVSEMHDPYIPSFSSYWKGCFNLPNGPLKFSESFSAHPPSKAHYKVCETTKKLPEDMYFELVSNGEIGTDIFPADRDDIGLYFFPMSKMRSGHDIIDFIWRNNMVLKTHVEDVELFVLSSRVLPAHAQEFHGSCFLWGVFRRPKAAKKVANTRPLIVTSCAPCDDAPPGFERICKESTNTAPCDDTPPGFERTRSTNGAPCADVPPGYKRICRR